MGTGSGDQLRPVWNKRLGPKIRFVLVEPQNGGNIGAAARAIRVCGHDELAIVNLTVPLDHGPAYAMAWGSLDLLKNSLKTESLEDALQGCTLAVATSARPRHRERGEVYSPEEVGQKLASFDPDSTVAIVFGREDSGLSNDEMERCEWWTKIPSASVYPCYNLAQSVQIYAYELFKAFHSGEAPEPKVAAEPAQIEWFYRRLREQLERSGFQPRDGMDDFINHARGILGDIAADRHANAFMHKLLDGLLGLRTH